MKGREEFGGREVGSGCPRKGRNVEIGSHRLTPRGAPQTGEWLRDAMSLHHGDYSWEQYLWVHLQSSIPEMGG